MLESKCFSELISILVARRRTRGRIGPPNFCVQILPLCIPLALNNTCVVFLEINWSLLHVLHVSRSLSSTRLANRGVMRSCCVSLQDLSNTTSRDLSSWKMYLGLRGSAGQALLRDSSR